MQIKADVPSTPLRSRSGLLFPNGFIFLILIMDNVINKLSNDLKKTNSYIGILLSIFFTHTVIKLKKNEASTKLNFFNE